MLTIFKVFFFVSLCIKVHCTLHKWLDMESQQTHTHEIDISVSAHVHIISQQFYSFVVVIIFKRNSFVLLDV